MVQELPELRFDVEFDRDPFVVEPVAAPRPSAQRRWQRRLSRSVFVTDALSLAVAITAAHLLRYVVLPRPGGIAGTNPYVIGVSVGLFLDWMIGLAVMRTRDPKILDSGAAQYQAVARASFYVFGWIAIFAVVLQIWPSRVLVGFAGIVGVLLLFLTRRMWRWWVMKRRSHGELTANVLMIGGVRSAKTMMQRFGSDAGYGLRVVGVWVPDRVASPDERFRVGELDVQVLGTESDLNTALAIAAIDTVVVTDTEHLGHDGMRELAWALEGRDVDLLVAPNVVDVAGPRVHLEAHGNMPLIYLSGPRYSRARSLQRVIFDRGFAALVLIAASPVLLLSVLAIRLTSKGPVFYRSERIGEHGVPFQMYKLRTMIRGADQVREELAKHNMASGPLFKMQNDPRVTSVGRILRRYSIDELPQFVNVLKGDMSIVGPRPPLRVEVDAYDETIRRRLLIKQGVTGLWQVSGRSDLSWEDSVRLDLDYVENWSMLRDLQIILRTLRAVLASHGAY